MRYAIIHDGTPVEVFPGQCFQAWLQVETPPAEEGGEPGSELQAFTVPHAWLDFFTPAEFEQFGVRHVMSAVPPPGERLATADLGIGFDGGDMVVVEQPIFEAVPADTLDELKATMLAQLQGLYETKYAQGFAYEFGGVTETLQMRAQDLVNWLAFKDTCNDGIAAGFGAAPCPQNIRVTSNAEYTVSFAQGAAVMTSLKAYGGALLARQWSLKDAIRSAPDAEALTDIDIHSGWPA